MVYRGCWNLVRKFDWPTGIDKSRAIQTLVGILTDPDGRVFVSCLVGECAELCIEIFDQVTQDLHSLFHPNCCRIEKGENRDKN